MKSLFDLQLVSTLMAVGTFGAALVALIIASRQINVSREMEAMNAYEKYHHLILQYPELGAGGFDWSSASTEERRRYVTFVMSMLLTLERVMVLYPNDPSWEAAFDDDLVPHQAFLCSLDFKEHASSINPIVADLIKRTAKRHRWEYGVVA